MSESRGWELRLLIGRTSLASRLINCFQCWVELATLLDAVLNDHRKPCLRACEILIIQIGIESRKKTRLEMAPILK